ncbi:MAG: PepSY-associated TM helix domain-containing protein [Pseudomonadota bacterium]
MSMVDQAKSKRLLAVHGWSGTILGLLLFVVVLTGSVAVLAHEIGIWSSGGSASAQPLNSAIATKVTELSADVPEEWREEVGIFNNSKGNIRVFFHGHETNPESGNLEDIGVMYEIERGTYKVISERQGFSRDLFGNNRASALDRFIAELHINLHLPSPWGLYATGLLGLIMMIAAISGLILHKHLFRDMFVAPRFSSLLLNKRDRHILAGTWSLPFAFVLAFTGAFFSFAGSIGLPVVVMSAFGGDQEKAVEILTAADDSIAEDPTPQAMTTLGSIFADVEQRAGVAPTNATITNFGRADAKVMLSAAPADGEIFGGTHVYKAADGSYVGQQAIFGLEESAATVAIGLVSVLHFGQFAGLLSKAIWVALGLAMCYVTESGMRLWIQRRSESRLWRGFGRVTTIFAYGTPLAMATAAMGYFATYSSGGDTQASTSYGFVLGCVLATILGLRRVSESAVRRGLGAALIASMAVLPIIRIVTGGPGWGTALNNGGGIIVTMDLLLLACVVIFAWREFGPFRIGAAAPQPVAEPAE